jgi:hypothetical protein
MKVKKLIAHIYISTQLLVLSALTAPWTFIWASTCEVDLSSQLGPVRDQETDGICHVAAASTLMTQHLHSTGKKNFQPSWLDAMNCGEQFQIPNNGGIPAHNLDCMIRKGVCSEESAPYSSRVELNRPCTGDKNKFGQKYCAPKELVNKCRNAECLPENPTEKNYALNSILGFEDYKSTQDSKMAPQMMCLRDHLIGEKCKNNREKFDPSLKSRVKKLENETVSDKRDFICNRLKENKSMVLGLCLNHVDIDDVQAMFGNYLKRSPAQSSGDKNGKLSDCQGAHAVVVAGSRMNKNGKQELYIRNSWGKDAPLEGWVEAEKIYPAMESATYLGTDSANKRSQK